MKYKYEPRDYQKPILEKLKNLFDLHKDDQRIFLQTPTGTGKTFLAFFHIKHCYENKPTHIVWTAHQTELVNQSKEEFYDMIGQESNGNVIQFGNIKIEFVTWQSLRKRTDTFDLLVIDEVHCGGSMPFASGDKKKDKDATILHTSFLAIMKLAKSHFYISASPYKLDKNLFPGLLVEVNKKQYIIPERVVKITRQQAYEMGAIVNVKMISIQTSNKLKLNGTDYNFDTMSEGAQILKDNEADINDATSKQILDISTRESLLKVYCEREIRNKKIPQTVIFCKNKSNTELSADAINKEIRKCLRRFEKEIGIKLPSGKSLIRTVTSESASIEKDFEDFKDSKFPILCVVGMAREGFNAPKIEVAIDFSYSVTNRRTLEQKIGRTVRTCKEIDKKYARYYYPNTFKDYLLTVNGKTCIREEARNKIESIIMENNPDITPEQMEAAISAMVDIAEMNEELYEDENLPIVDIKTEEMNFIDQEGEKQTIYITETSSCIEDSYNTNPEKNLTSKFLLDNIELDKDELDFSTLDKVLERSKSWIMRA